jgi:uncharacterized protein with GYD domain
LKYEIACDSNRQKQGARNMPRYLHTFSYSKEAVKGLVSKPENRIEAVRPLIEAAGGKVEE